MGLNRRVVILTLFSFFSLHHLFSVRCWRNWIELNWINNKCSIFEYNHCYCLHQSIFSETLFLISGYVEHQKSNILIRWVHWTLYMRELLKFLFPRDLQSYYHISSYPHCLLNTDCLVFLYTPRINVWRWCWL